MAAAAAVRGAAAFSFAAANARKIKQQQAKRASGEQASDSTMQASGDVRRNMAATAAKEEVEHEVKM
jgi:hypothetical protein